MRIEFKKGYAETICNALRQAAYCQRKVLRPIAVKVGDSSNVLAMGPLVLEDSIEFTTNLISLDFTPNREFKEDEIIEVSSVCTNVVKLQDLINEDINVYKADLNREMLHFVEMENPTGMKVTVYYRYTSGNASIEENSYALATYLNKGTSMELDRSIVVLNSRHNDIAAFGFEVNPDNLEKDVVSFSITSKVDIDPKSILEEAANSLIASLEDVKAKL